MEQSKRSQRDCMILANRQGSLASAHALYWEGIVLARIHESWTEGDFERFRHIIKFFETRARFAPSTFRHKALFLQGKATSRALGDFAS
jgi:hypothetical protein